LKYAVGKRVSEKFQRNSRTMLKSFAALSHMFFKVEKADTLKFKSMPIQSNQSISVWGYHLNIIIIV